MAIADSKTIKYLKSFYIKDYLIIILGLISYAIGITGFIMPNGIVTGGLAGICLILNYKLGADLAITYWIINFILLVIGFKAIHLPNTHLYNYFIGIDLGWKRVFNALLYRTPSFERRLLKCNYGRIAMRYGFRIGLFS